MPLWKPIDDAATGWYKSEDITRATWVNRGSIAAANSDMTGKHTNLPVVGRGQNGKKFATSFVDGNGTAANGTWYENLHSADAGPFDTGTGPLTMAVFLQNDAGDSGNQFVVSNAAFYSDFNIVVKGTDPYKTAIHTKGNAGNMQILIESDDTSSPNTTGSSLSAPSQSGNTSKTFANGSNALVVASRDTDRSISETDGGTGTGKGMVLKLSNDGKVTQAFTYADATNVRVDIDASNLGIGAEPNDTGDNAADHCEIYEVIGFKDESTALREKTEGYLAFKFNHPIDSGNTYSSGPPTACHCVAEGTLGTDQLFSNITDTYELDDIFNVRDELRN
jgi:hypothetical protein